MASFVWPSVMVHKGSRLLVARTLLKCSWNKNFASVLERLEIEYSSELVSKITISSNERMVEPAHTEPLDAPIKIIEIYGCHYICYNLFEKTVRGAEASDTRNVATVLMESARELVQPPIVTPS